MQIEQLPYFTKMLENSGVDINTGKVDIGVLQGRPGSETK